MSNEYKTAEEILQRHTYNGTLDDGTKINVIDYEDAVKLIKTFAAREVEKAVNEKKVNITSIENDGAEETDKLLNDLAEEFEGKVKAFVLKGFKIAAKRFKKDYDKKVLILESELTEAKKRIEELEEVSSVRNVSIPDVSDKLNIGIKTTDPK